ncbi:hypothetical protein N9478_03555 [Gammaproteobacteria bacterium]|nr:hypothetical protein [Gammaproteobacteria bacterium]
MMRSLCVVSLWFFVVLNFTKIANAQHALLYDDEYEVIEYGTSDLQDIVSRLQERIIAKEATLSFSTDRGYLDSVLQELNISSTSQILVFSKTSLQQPLISPETPRALYFNDEVYVGWVQGSGILEVASMDPDLGPVFFTLEQKETETPVFNREYELCLRCHDSLSLSGGGTPRFIMSSNYTGILGQLVSHEGSVMTTSRTPIRSRWGGWFVSGLHGEQKHLGNVIIESAADLSDERLATSGNLFSIAEVSNLAPYISPFSDIVALMVIEHQIEVQNEIARVNFQSRTLLADDKINDIELNDELLSIAEGLIDSLFMTGQPEFLARINGTSGFSENFMSRGKKDSQGRSLRELDLSKSLFKYPFSYLIYSDAYASLPKKVREIIGQRIKEVLSPEYSGDFYPHISPSSKIIIAEILDDTGFVL